MLILLLVTLSGDIGLNRICKVTQNEKVTEQNFIMFVFQVPTIRRKIVWLPKNYN